MDKAKGRFGSGMSRQTVSQVNGGNRGFVLDWDSMSLLSWHYSADKVNKQPHMRRYGPVSVQKMQTRTRGCEPPQ